MDKILIVDDQDFYLKSLELALQHQYEPVLASTYDEAIKKLQEDISIALIDVRLEEEDPENIDGLKILEWIQMNKPEIASFIMSAYREFSYAEQALNLGAKHFFKKPIDIKSLRAILEDKA